MPRAIPTTTVIKTMPSLTVENYLKTALQISMKTGADWVSPGKLALALDVSPGTVTSMLKTLDDADLAVYKPYEGVCLTDAGQRLALRMLRRHRIIETFLVETLQLSWDQVHIEAENMEHAVSDLLIDRMDEFLGMPDCDPHGAPIPAPDGRLRSRQDNWQPLSDCKVGQHIRFVRVVNQQPDFLRYLSNSGFELGTEGLVSQNSVEAEIVCVDIPSGTISIGRHAASTIHVTQHAEQGPSSESADSSPTASP